MARELLTCAKITRPAVSGILFRERLFAELEKCLVCPVIWISAPAGAGKTSLISSYFDYREAPCLWYRVDVNDADPATFFHYLRSAALQVLPDIQDLPILKPKGQSDISSFSQTFFTQLFSQLDQPLILVLDNFQEIPEDIQLHDHILEAFKWMSEGSRVIIASRKKPSSKYTRLLANRIMTAIYWRDIRFSREEFYEIADRLGCADVTRNTLFQIYEKMDGWIAGLLFILERVKKNNIKDLRNVDADFYVELFMYLAEEIFDYQDSDIKSFLLKTALLPYVTTQLARELTGNSWSERVLTALNHHNAFADKIYLSREVVYMYHPIFREFLKSKIHDFFRPEEVSSLERDAAGLLLEKNHVEEAAELIHSSGDIKGLIELIVNHAPEFISQRRHKLLAQWLTGIPPQQFSDNPWLSFWLGSCLQHLKPLQAREKFQIAFDSFCSRRNMAGSFAAWVGLANSIIIEWHDFTRLDSLIYWLESHYDHESSVLSDHARGQVVTCMAAALLIRRPESRDILKWVELVKKVAKHTRDVNLQVEALLVAGNYYLWLGDQCNCWFFLSRIRTLCRLPGVSTITKLKAKLFAAMMYNCYLGDASKCLQVVADALEIASLAGIHMMDHMFFVMGASGSIMSGDYTGASEFLQQIEDSFDRHRGHCYFCYNYLASWVSLMRGNTLRAMKHATEALNKAEETGHVYHEALGRFAYAQILFAKGDLQAAHEQLASFEENAEATNSSILKYMCLLAKAQLLFGRGKDQDGIKNLKTALELGRREKYRNMLLWWDPSVMTHLCMRALEENIETEYVQSLITRRGLVPDTPPVEIEQWPWFLRVYTFGRFEIVKDGKPLRLKGKAQQKPLSLFKALITLGGRNISSLHLADMLWQDADGDMQQKSLSTTLHRLRRILGKNDLIDFQDGHLSINAKYCWIDTWAFERLLSKAEYESERKTEESASIVIRCAEKAIDLYKGDFLLQNNMEYSCVTMREHLKSRFLRGVKLLGRNLEKSGQQEKAVTRYLRALEVDSMVEEFYQRLMIYYQRQGLNSDAVAIFKRCQKNFSSILQVEPSVQTRAIYKSIIKEHSGRDDSHSGVKRKNIAHTV